MSESRPTEHAPLDAWADVQRIQEERSLEQERHQRKISDRKHELLKDTLAVTAILGVFAANILGIGWFIYDNVNNTREGDLQMQEQETLQVEACVSLQEPIERAFCLIQIGEPQ